MDDRKILTLTLHTQDDLERMATHSLTGRLITKHPGIDLARDVKKVIIRFQETTMAWKQRHGGPNTIIMPEHTPCCLYEDVIALMRWGIEVEVMHDEVLTDTSTR